MNCKIPKRPNFGWSFFYVEIFLQSDHSQESYRPRESRRQIQNKLKTDSIFCAWVPNFKSTFLNDYWAIFAQISRAIQWWVRLSIFHVDITWYPRGFSWFFKSHRMELCNTPLDAELPLLFIFYNSEMDLVTYHTITLKIYHKNEKIDFAPKFGTEMMYYSCKNHQNE